MLFDTFLLVTCDFRTDFRRFILPNSYNSHTLFSCYGVSNVLNICNLASYDIKTDLKAVGDVANIRCNLTIKKYLVSMRDSRDAWKKKIPQNG